MGKTPPFKRFQKQRKRWISFFSKEDENSISNQIELMFRDDAFFRLINEIRGIRLEAKDKSKGLNGHLSELLDRGYVVSQSTAIRCLIDKRSDVISIGRLLDDLKEHQNLFTRINYITVENGLYDPKDCTTDLNSCFCSASHDTFDKLSSTLPGSRTPDDLIGGTVFTQVEINWKKLN